MCGLRRKSTKGEECESKKNVLWKKREESIKVYGMNEEGKCLYKSESLKEEEEEGKGRGSVKRLQRWE